LTSRDELEEIDEVDSRDPTRPSSASPSIFPADSLGQSPSRQDTVTAGSSAYSYKDRSGEPTPRAGLISLAQDNAPSGVGVSIGRNRMSSRGSSKVNLGSSAGTARHTIPGHPAQRIFGEGTATALQDEVAPDDRVEREGGERTPLLGVGMGKATAHEAEGYGTQEVRARRKSSADIGGSQGRAGGDSGFRSNSSRGRRRSSGRLVRRRSEIILGESTDGQTVSRASRFSHSDWWCHRP